MITAFSEPLAFMPFILRAVRISKLFEAREIYCETDKMPKDMIWKWREANIIKKFLLLLIVWAIISMTI